MRCSVVPDASGTFNTAVREAALARMTQAGAQTMNWFSVACELHRDWRNDIEGLDASPRTISGVPELDVELHGQKVEDPREGDPVHRTGGRHPQHVDRLLGGAEAGLGARRDRPSAD